MRPMSQPGSVGLSEKPKPGMEGDDHVEGVGG